MLLPVASGFAATATELVPARGPRGANAIVVGTGLDASNIAVSFASSSGRVAAPVVERTPGVLDITVPLSAVSGDVLITSGGSTIGSFVYTVTESQPFVKIATLAADVFREPSGVAVGPAGDVYVADRLHHQIRSISPGGLVTLLAGSGRPGVPLKEPAGVAFDVSLNVLYVADTGNHVIRRVSGGLVSVVAGLGKPGDADGTAMNASFKFPTALALDRDGNLYVADSGNHKIRKVTPAAVVTTVAGGLKEPQGVAFSSSDILYIADTGNHVIRKLENGLLSVVAGNGHPGSSDGPALLSELHAPAGLTIGTDGTLFIADSGNHQIRALRPDGTLVTIAGDGKPGLLKLPTGVAAAGAIFAGDTGNDTVRAIYPAVALSDIFPRNGDPAGGTLVRIFGDGFVAGRTAVTIGGVAAAAAWISPTELQATTPPGTMGARDVVVTTPGGAATLPGVFVYQPPFVSIAVTPSAASLEPGATRQFTASGIRVDGSSVDLTSTVLWASSTPAVATIDASGLAKALAVGSTTITASFGVLTGSATLTVEPLPPDPSTVAPPPDLTVVPSLVDEISFLYTGPNPIQTGVAPDTITATRATLLRGAVITTDGSPLPGVRVSILGHTELGHTLSRADGMYDLAINGGGALTVAFEKRGFIPAQRLVTTKWNEQRVLDPVALVAYDAAATSVSFGQPAVQVARGSVAADADGARRATVLFPAGVTASLRMTDGTLRAVSSLTVRATEVTVGANGPKAMPAMLPATSGYTYCVELSADEAVEAGAAEIRFSRPVPFYVENFIGFPVGGIVPVGYYDRARSAWMAGNNAKWCCREGRRSNT